jgi:arsenite methyltransferase
VRKNMELWIGCVAGALEEQEFISLLTEAGFEHPSIEPTRVYEAKDAAAFLAGTGLDVTTIAPQIEGKFISAFVRGTKPAAGKMARALDVANESCCGPDCCSA